jgi:glycosyltransferase involved in cell wall biosynthesis
MRILHIIPYLSIGGAQRLVIDICNSLAKQKDVEVRLITFENFNDYPHLSKDIDLKVVPAHLKLSVLKKNRIHIDALQEAIENFSPDIIHSHLFEADIVSRSCFYPRAKWFSHGHDNMVQLENIKFTDFFNKTRITNFFEKQYLLKRYKKNGGNHFIAISRHTYNYYSRVMPRHPLSLLHNAFEYQRFYKELSFADISSKIRLINIGSFVTKKNQSLLLDVAVKLKQKEIDFELVMLGDGPDKEDVEKRAKHLNLEKEVKFLGNVSHVENYLWQSGIYVHSATYEPFGLVLLEAMASGLPVVCLDGGGNIDIIEDGENGFMIKEQDTEQFAEKIIKLKENRELYEKMSRYAQQFSRKYDTEGYADKLLEIYSS